MSSAAGAEPAHSTPKKPQSDSSGMAPATPAIDKLGPVEEAVPAVGAASSTPAADRPAAPESSSSSSSSSSSESSPSSDYAEEDAEASGAGYSSSSEGEDLAELVKQKLVFSKEMGVQLAPTPVLDSFDLEGVAALIKSGRVNSIVCMCGAGISVSAGIPDFRTPGTGLYSQLAKYQLPHPHAVFEMDYFRRNPRPFFLLAKELFPGSYLPTPTHFFMKLLHDKGLLRRCFTQNIDSLEHEAGLPAEAVVAAHGNFDTARCIRCKRAHSIEHVRAAVFAGDGSPCRCEDKHCGGLVKPDIVFFGESLPARFFQLAPPDFEAADLLIVMGTSLVVQPFASLIDYVETTTPRLLINREKAGEISDDMRALGYEKGFNFGPGNYRDALFLGDCDDGVRRLCRLLGWEGELDALIAQGRQRFQAAAAAPGAVEDAVPKTAASGANL